MQNVELMTALSIYKFTSSNNRATLVKKKSLKPQRTSKRNDECSNYFESSLIMEGEYAFYQLRLTGSPAVKPGKMYDFKI